MLLHVQRLLQQNPVEDTENLLPICSRRHFRVANALLGSTHLLLAPSDLPTPAPPMPPPTEKSSSIGSTSTYLPSVSYQTRGSPLASSSGAGTPDSAGSLELAVTGAPGASQYPPPMAVRLEDVNPANLKQYEALLQTVTLARQEFYTRMATLASTQKKLFNSSIYTNGPGQPTEIIVTVRRYNAMVNTLRACVASCKAKELHNIAVSEASAYPARPPDSVSLASKESSLPGELTRAMIRKKTLRKMSRTRQLKGSKPKTASGEDIVPRKVTSMLRQWLYKNFLHPYPTDKDKRDLAVKTGLTRVQVSNWFINARVRLWRPIVFMMCDDEGNLDPVGEGYVVQGSEENPRALENQARFTNMLKQSMASIEEIPSVEPRDSPHVGGTLALPAPPLAGMHYNEQDEEGTNNEAKTDFNMEGYQSETDDEAMLYSMAMTNNGDDEGDDL
eukprot:gene17518-20857_t